MRLQFVNVKSEPIGAPTILKGSRRRFDKVVAKATEGLDAPFMASLHSPGQALVCTDETLRIRPAKGDFTCQRLAGYRAPMNDAIGPLASVPLSSALELIEAQRAEAFAPYGGKAFHIVGGFVEETTVDRSGIRSRVLKRWHDQIGQPISTGPAKPNFLAAAIADACRAA